ncbi:MAG: hypothetical protein J0M34_00870 [Alphaproteobacteria bacterium]|nr:hypothetical protein [Alphaproteobacteria bacterium]
MQEFADIHGSGGARVTQSSVAGTSAMRDFHVPHPAPIIAAQHVTKAFEKEDQKDRAFIGTVQTVGGILSIPMFMDLGTALLAKALTLNGLIKGSWEAKVNGVLRAPIRALKDTELRDWKNFGNRVQLKRHEFNMRQGVENAKLDAWYEQTGKHLKIKDGKVAGSSFGQALENKAGKLVEKGPLKWLDDQVRKFANWRAKRLVDAAHKQVVELPDLMTGTATKEPGFIGKNLMGKSAVSTATQYDVLKEGIVKLKDIHDPRALETALHEGIDGVRHTANKTVADAALGGLEHSNYHKVRVQLRHGATAATAAAGWKDIGAEGGSAIARTMRALPKGLGRASIFHVLFGVGATLTAGAKLMDLSRDTKLEKSLVKEFAADVYGVSAEQVTKEMMLGKDAHPLVKQAAETALKAKGGRGIYGALNTGFEILNVSTMKGLGMAGVAAMPWYGAPNMPGLEQLSHNMLIGENSSIKAYQHLKDADAGKVQLAPEQRVGLVRFMIASIPGIAKNMGVDNRLVEPMAEALVSKGLNARQTLQAIANPEQMTALAREATEALAKKAEEAKRVAAAKKDAAPETKKNAAPEADHPKTKELPSMQMAAAPAKQVSMAEASHEGMVETRQKAQAH